MKLLTHIKNELNTVVLTHAHEYSTGLAGQIHSPPCSLTWRSPVTAVCRAPPYELSRVIFRRVLYLCVCVHVSFESIIFKSSDSNLQTSYECQE